MMGCLGWLLGMHWSGVELGTAVIVGCGQVYLGMLRSALSTGLLTTWPLGALLAEIRKNGAATEEGEDCEEADEALRPPPERQEDLHQVQLAQAQGY